MESCNEKGLGPQSGVLSRGGVRRPSRTGPLRREFRRFLRRAVVVRVGRRVTLGDTITVPLKVAVRVGFAVPGPYPLAGTGTEPIGLGRGLTVPLAGRTQGLRGQLWWQQLRVGQLHPGQDGYYHGAAPQRPTGVGEQASRRPLLR